MGTSHTGEVHFPWRDRMRVAVGCAEALAAIHAHKFIHRDFKSANVLLREDLTPVVADFGVARTIEDWKTHVTTDVVGSAGYIDPVYFQNGQLSQKSDTYAFGIFLLELISGFPPIIPQGEDLTPVVADFGLARTIDDWKTHVSTKVVGSMGYIDPIYFQTGQLSQKSDTFAFGVFLLELMSGCCPLSAQYQELRQLIISKDLPDPLLVMDPAIEGEWARRPGEVHFPWRDRMRVAVGCAEALAAIHAHKFIHRDFKSANVLLREDLTPVVADFGVARTIEDWKTHVTTDVVGSAGYIDPVYFQNGQLSQKSDTYAFGIFLLELISGFPPIIPQGEDLTPVVADFGLARTIDDWKTHVSTKVVGSMGYIDPIYFQTGQLSQKSDTFAFGVFLLELMSGCCPLSAQYQELRQLIISKDLPDPLLVMDPAIEGDPPGRVRLGEVHFPWRDRMRVAVGCAEALAAIHAHKFIHRDFKSANVLLREKTHVTTDVVGSAGYIDPVYFQNGQLSQKSDTYAFGVFLLELISGFPPITTENLSLAASIPAASTASCHQSTNSPPTASLLRFTSCHFLHLSIPCQCHRTMPYRNSLKPSLVTSSPHRRLSALLSFLSCPFVLISSESPQAAIFRCAKARGMHSSLLSSQQGNASPAADIRAVETPAGSNRSVPARSLETSVGLHRRVSHAASRGSRTGDGNHYRADADDSVSSKYGIEEDNDEDGEDDEGDDGATENLPISLVIAALFLDTKGQSRTLIKKLCSFDSFAIGGRFFALPGVTHTASFVRLGIGWLQTHLNVPVMSHADAYTGHSFSADALAKGDCWRKAPCGSCSVSIPKEHEHGNDDHYLSRRVGSSKQVLPLVGFGAIAILVLLVRGGMPSRTAHHRIFPFPKISATTALAQSTTAAWLDLTALFFLFFGTAALTRFSIIHLIRRHPHLSLPLAALLSADRRSGRGCAGGSSAFMRDLCGKAAKMGLGGGFWRAKWWQAQLSPSPRGRRSSAQLGEWTSATSADFLRYLRPSGTGKNLSKSEDTVDEICLTVRRYTNGDRYEGETSDGVASGSGVYYFDEAAGKYEGEWADGKYSGLGVESWESGSVYRGGYKRGYREGRGLYQFHTGDAYAGAWARGQSHGAGMQMCSDGSTYTGQFSYGLKHGFGKYTFRNGDTYAGEYFRDAMHGYGVYTFSNGHRYEGAWHDGCKQGLGRYTFCSGDSLMGHWHLGALLTRCHTTAHTTAQTTASATSASAYTFDSIAASGDGGGSFADGLAGDGIPLPSSPSSLSYFSAAASPVTSPSAVASTSPSAVASPSAMISPSVLASPWGPACQSQASGRPSVDPAKVQAAVEAAQIAEKRAEALSDSDESLSEVVAAANQAAATARQVAAEARAVGPQPETKNDLQSKSKFML
ncbi:hypothetical protein CLOP_g5672 [Closterium sp. NIES-67]|nr:hypothetical protein CLOP_g5672 [Closterium sp. NIES-67]